jgi:predicted DNA-binding transcriptional regulator AlpA
MRNNEFSSKKKLLGTDEVLRKMAISRSTLTRRVGEGVIPKPIKVKKSSYWIESEIDELIEELAAKRGELFGRVKVYEHDHVRVGEINSERTPSRAKGAPMTT